MGAELLPSLLRIYEVTDLLGINRSQLQCLYPHLHVLQMPHQSRRLAAPYVEAFRDFSKTSNRKRRTLIARDFAHTRVAHMAIQAAETTFEEELTQHLIEVDDGELAISGVDMAATLNLQRSSITDWKRSGALRTFTRDGQLWITEAVLRDAIVWQWPQDYDPLRYEELAE